VHTCSRELWETQDSDTSIVHLFERGREQETERERERERERAQRERELRERERDSQEIKTIHDSLNRGAPLPGRGKEIPWSYLSRSPARGWSPYLIMNLTRGAPVVTDSAVRYLLSAPRKGMTIFFIQRFSGRFFRQEPPADPDEGRFNIRLWRLCFTVWDTRPHSAPSTSIVRLIYVFSRVIRSPPSPPLPLSPRATLRRPCHRPLPSLPLAPHAAVPVEEGRSPWQRRVSRRPIVGRLRHGTTSGSARRTRRTIIIDREGKGAIGVVKGMCESVVWTA